MLFSVDIHGMSCEGCVRRLTKLLGGVQGVRVVRISVGHVEVDLTGGAGPDDVRSVIRTAGWEPVEDQVA